MGSKPNKTGRNPKEHYTTLERSFLETPAWRALSCSAKAIYPFVKLEWHGSKFNNNGKIQLSIRQAAERVGIGVNAAMRAFHDLQAKGYLVITQMGALGIEGEARGPSYEITEIALPGSGKHAGRRLFDQWREGADFPIAKHHVNNPRGRNGQKNPAPKQRRSHLENSDVTQNPVTKSVTPYPHKGDVSARKAGFTVPKTKTSLVTTTKAKQHAQNLSEKVCPDLCPLTQSPNFRPRTNPQLRN